MITKKNKVGLNMHTAKWLFSLTIFWLFLSGYLSPLLLSFGVLSIALVLYLLYRMEAVDKEHQQFGTWLQIIRYLPWLFGQILSSSIRVTKLVWGSPDKVTPALAKFNVGSVPLVRRTLYANSITLTPGTLSVDLIDGELTVHALEKASIDELKEGYMERKITSIWGEDK